MRLSARHGETPRARVDSDVSQDQVRVRISLVAPHQPSRVEESLPVRNNVVASSPACYTALRIYST